MKKMTQWSKVTQFVVLPFEAQVKINREIVLKEYKNAPLLILKQYGEEINSEECRKRYAKNEKYKPLYMRDIDY